MAYRDGVADIGDYCAARASAHDPTYAPGRRFLRRLAFRLGGLRLALRVQGPDAAPAPLASGAWRARVGRYTLDWSRSRSCGTAPARLRGALTRDVSAACDRGHARPERRAATSPRPWRAILKPVVPGPWSSSSRRCLDRRHLGDTGAIRQCRPSQSSCCAIEVPALSRRHERLLPGRPGRYNRQDGTPTTIAFPDRGWTDRWVLSKSPGSGRGGRRRRPSSTTGGAPSARRAHRPRVPGFKPSC